MDAAPSDDQRPAWVPDDVDLGRPNPARMYDYYLGGAHNFGPDRELAEAAIAVMPWMREAVRANRGFLRRAVAACARDGIRQFLDLGAGIPTVGATHHVAQAIAPDARVVYVDNEPVAYAHTGLLLDGVPGTAVVSADLTEPAAVVADPGVHALLDWSEPVAVLTLAVLHFVPDPDAATAILDGYREAMTPGGALLFSHVTADHDPEQAEQAEAVYRRSSTPVSTRSHAELLALLHGFDLAEPGLVDATDWRPEPPAVGEHAGFYAALGRPRP